MSDTPWVDIYSNVDNRFVEWVHSVVHYYDDDSEDYHKVPLVFATPERAFAQMKKRLEKKMGPREDGKRQNPTPKVVPLPFGSVNRLNHAYDHTRYTKFWNHKMWLDEDTGVLYGSPAKPQPITFNYQVDFWARLLRDLDMFTAQIVKQLRSDQIYLKVDYGFPEKELLTRFVLQDFRDLSQLEPGNEQRALRKGFTFEVQAWIPYDAVEHHQVHEITVDVIESPDMETEKAVLDTIEVSSE